MAEVGKGVNAGKLASNVQKRITRAQEKVCVLTSLCMCNSYVFSCCYLVCTLSVKSSDTVFTVGRD